MAFSSGAIAQEMLKILTITPKSLEFVHSTSVRKTNICQCKCILSWASRKLAWVRGILYRTYTGHLFSGKCSKNLVSHTEHHSWMHKFQNSFLDTVSQGTMNQSTNIAAASPVLPPPGAVAAARPSLPPRWPGPAGSRPVAAWHSRCRHSLQRKGCVTTLVWLFLCLSS